MITQDDIHQARILIVDDQPVNVELLRYLLAGTGYRNVDTTTESSKVEALHREHGYDLIILDLHMPGMSGFDVMAAMAPMEAGSYLPVLVVTADPDSKLAALEAGARDFVSKPFDPLEVLTRIRNMVEVRLMQRRAKQYNTLLEQTVRLRTAELQRFRSAMDATADAIFLIDADSVELVDANGGACRMLGYQREQLLAMAPADLLPGLMAQLAAQGGAAPDPARPPQLIECELARRRQAPLPVELYWQPLAQSRILIAVARDISERRQALQRLEHMAHYDTLTGLPNRTLFYRSLAEAIVQARDKAWGIAVLFIALDRFRNINESLGATLADELLRQFSSRLVRCVRGRDTAGRLGGDEFALVLTMASGQQEAVQVANELREALRAPFELDGHAAVLTASIGIAMYPDDADEPDTLIKYADTAMERARLSGRDGYRFFTSGMNVQVLARLDLELALRHAHEHDEFALHYQPKVNLHTGRISGVEALLRWRRPGYGLVVPSEFVPVLEETGLIVRVGAWIIDTACRQIAHWIASGVGPVRVAVNVTSRQFVETDLYEEVRGALERHRVSADLLELELTEGALMTNAERTVGVLTRLRGLGVKIAIDDFGTGYSSLAYLQRFPIDKLKIDIAFVRDVTTNPNDAAIALAIISMAHSLKMRVIAEGVEQRAQFEYLRRNRCDEIQGFYFSRALPGRELGQLVEAGGKLGPESGQPGQFGQTLLLVDADVAVLAALERLLQPEGYQILTATTPARGLELLALHQVQVVVCEQRMPAMSGTEFLGRVKQLYPATMRIVLSTETGLEAVLEAINRGAIYRFYTKPWNDAQLRENIRLAFDHYWRIERHEGGATASAIVIAEARGAG